jgi:DNA mismatch repair protein MutS
MNFFAHLVFFLTPFENLNASSCRIVILTGPNMAGKSTYLRQTALIGILAQIGSFVPAKSARVGLLDRIFTRIGSGDRLAQGESTFMVEMRETARILANATERSLIILDEVGRGTSTYDGISIAWSIVDYLSKVRSKVLFATHYFELTELESQMEGVRNFNVLAKEHKDTVIFLHKIAAGSADRSYGIHVAQLAGLPASVVDKAKKILDKLEKEHHSVLKSKQDRQQELTLG